MVKGMTPPLYLSAPALRVPPTILTNDDVKARVAAHFTGDPDQWPLVELGMELIFGASQSALRHKEMDPDARHAELAAAVAWDCLDQHGLAPEDLDLVLYAGIGRDYLEPATAMEVAARLGIERVQGMDVLSACAGQLMAVMMACGQMGLNPGIRAGLVCSAELMKEPVVYRLNGVDELAKHGAGLTLGDASAAWLITRTPPRGGGLRICAVESRSLPQHWALSTTPIHGRFTAHSSEMLRVLSGEESLLGAVLERLGWALESVAQVLMHQPGEAMHRRVAEVAGLRPDQALNVHGQYGNTGSVSVATALWEHLRRAPPKDGDRLVLIALGAGMTGVVIAGEWVSGAEAP